MFVLSIKSGKKQLVFTLLAVCALATVAVLALAIPPVKSTSATEVPVVSTRGGTGEERVAFLKNLGYETEAEAIEVEEIRLPDETDEAIRQYNEIQKKVGFDLEAYLGKRVKRYTYRVLNADASASCVCLYVYRDTVIAGHISTADGEAPLI